MVLNRRIDQTETTFANELLFIQALLKSAWAVTRTKGDLGKAEAAATLWLKEFREWKARFENVCEKLGLFRGEMVEDPAQEFVMPSGCEGEMEKRMAEPQKKASENTMGSRKMTVSEQEVIVQAPKGFGEKQVGLEQQTREEQKKGLQQATGPKEEMFTKHEQGLKKEKNLEQAQGHEKRMKLKREAIVVDLRDIAN